VVLAIGVSVWAGVGRPTNNSVSTPDEHLSRHAATTLIQS